MSSPIRCAILNDVGETSIREPTGNFWKRVDESPNRVADAVGEDDKA